LFEYRVAGRSLHSDRKIPTLERLSRHSSALPLKRNDYDGPASSGVQSRAVIATIFANREIGVVSQKIEVQVHADGWDVDISGVGHFRFERRSRIITMDGRAARADQLCVDEALFGPVLIPILADSGVWCVHGSAVAVRGRAHIFVGRSGVGKSTLARYLGQLGGDIVLLTDDITPLALLNNKLVCLPQFPQLKLALEEPVDSIGPEVVPVEAVYQLLESPWEYGENIEVSSRRFERSEGAAALLSHSVATRLFPDDILSAHLEFCVKAAEQVSVYQIGYPHQAGSLLALAELLNPVSLRARQ
jgi:hypothetical protein